MTTPHAPTVTVVICAYTERRWQQMVDAVNSVGKQSYRASQLVLVIDHNPALLERALAEFTDVDVVPNADESGLSGARNTGVRHAGGDIVAFLDDDALAEPDWLELLIAPYRDADVVGTGGVARAAWPVRRPSWFPPEFDWVVGCSYRGLPEGQAPVRNPIGANMSFRRLAFDRAGGFRSDFGRLGTLPLGCEETEFSIRVRRVIPEAQILHVPGAVVDHFVSTDRTTVKYFLRRCVAEGLSKATVTAHVGHTAGLASERRYITNALPRGFFSGLVPGTGTSLASPTRSGMIVAGLLATTLGYLLGKFELEELAGRLLAAPSTPVKPSGSGAGG
jgi:GT2 family glycosyltransferase